MRADSGKLRITNDLVGTHALRRRAGLFPHPARGFLSRTESLPFFYSIKDRPRSPMPHASLAESFPVRIWLKLLVKCIGFPQSSMQTPVFRFRVRTAPVRPPSPFPTEAASRSQMLMRVRSKDAIKCEYGRSHWFDFASASKEGAASSLGKTTSEEAYSKIITSQYFLSFSVLFAEQAKMEELSE